ncbi:MAG TPA: SIS domain-containing protein [Polyangiales bacterium]|nr:SIS domain-containing protein [Polyangiales bacterium]
MSFSKNFLSETARIAAEVDFERLDAIAEGLAEVRARQGRLFFLGVGGSAGNCGHAVNDFRKLCGFEAYAPTDNVSELTARINDDGWETIFVRWLQGSRLSAKDGLFIFSVGGGDLEKNVSTNLVRAMQYAQEVGAGIFGVVGRADGFAARASKTVAIVPTVNAAHVTPHTEAFQAVLWHLLVSHPTLKQSATKWESLGTAAGR